MSFSPRTHTNVLLSLLLSFLSCRPESPQRSTQLFSKKGDDDDDDDDDVTGKEDDMEELAGDKKPAAKEHDTDELSSKTLVVSGSFLLLDSSTSTYL
jgi:hypothetical protein